MLVMLGATTLAISASAQPLDPQKWNGRFSGTWEYRGTSGTGKPAEGKATILSGSGKICGVWVIGTGKDARTRIFFGKADGYRADVRLSDYLEPDGRKAPTWSEAHSSLIVDGNRIEGRLFGPQMHLRLVSPSVAADKTFAAACANKLELDFRLSGSDLWKQQCKLNGVPVAFPFDRGALKGRSGTILCTLGDEPSLEETINDGKSAGIRKIHGFPVRWRREEAIDEHGLRHGLERTYEASGRLEAERMWEHGAKVGLEKRYHEDGKPKRVAHSDRSGYNESVEYDTKGLLIELNCSTRGNVLAETRTMCGFDGKPVTTRVHGRNTSEVTYYKGRAVKYVAYWEDSLVVVRSRTSLEGNLDKRQTFYQSGKLELDTVMVVDADGAPKKPEDSRMRRYYVSGQIEADIQRKGKIVTEDWWHPNGKKRRELRSQRTMKDGHPVIRQTTVTYDESGHRVGEKTEYWQDN